MTAARRLLGGGRAPGAVGARRGQRSRVSANGLPPFQSDAPINGNDHLNGGPQYTRGYSTTHDPTPRSTAPPEANHPTTPGAEVNDPDDEAEMNALLSDGWYPNYEAQAQVRGWDADAAAPDDGSASGGTASRVTAEGSAKVLDLFERAATPIGTVERAQAALAAARAAKSPGIISITPGPAIEKKQAPKQDAAASMKEIEAAGATVNFAKSAAKRAAEAQAAAGNDPAARVKAINAALSDDQKARAAMAAKAKQRVLKGDSPSSFYSAGGGSSSSTTAAAPKGGPKEDFWSWTPPEATVDKGYYGDSAPGEWVPPMQRKKAPERVEQAVMLLERAPERKLPEFQSVVEASTALPAFQSDVEAAAGTMPSFQSEVEQLAAVTAPPPTPAPEAQPVTTGVGIAVEASLEDALASAVRELGAKVDDAKEGQLANGARWWREEGKEYLEDGKVMSWTCIRGASADGSVEWEERFWETSDQYTYRELGAVKSGRDAEGQAWQESWKEIYNHDPNGIAYIHREASKWSNTETGQCWSEGWTEDYRADGTVDRYCEKTGSLADGAAPEDGHANRWTEKWGEKWDGKGGCIKWTDTWANRDHAEGGQADAPSRSWGEKWEEKWGYGFNENGRSGSRQGSKWDEMGGGHRERTWGEEHYPDGRMHKYGNSSDGSEYWDEWQDGDGGWWERNPSFGWREAIGHSPNLMNVPLQPRTGGSVSKGQGGRSVITPHRGRRNVR